jgi:methyl-accepting chemotaxis protein
MKKTMKLKTKILLFFSAFIFVLCTVITIMSVSKSLSVATAIFAREGVGLAKKAADAIQGDKFEALVKSLDGKDPFYEEKRVELLNMKNETAARYLYTAGSNGKGSYVYIIDGSVEMNSNDFSAIGTSLNSMDFSPAFIKTWQTKTGQSSSLEKTGWGYLVSVFEPIKNSKGDVVGIVGCDFDAQFLYDSIKSQIIQQILLGILFAVAGVGVMFFFLYVIFKRLGEISEILSVIAEGEGNLSTKRIAVINNDEIGIMGTLFNQTLDKISALVLLIKDQTINLSNVGEELTDNMNQTSKVVTEITGNIKKIKGQVLTQSEAATDTTATMGEVVENISHLNTSVEAQTESVSQSSSAVEEMLANIKSVTNTLMQNAENVKNLNKAAELGKASIEEVSQDIQGIAKESEGLLEINAVMENIASQTNLLSMNAAIEAAHAGETGKGFAVVAGEIRKLAESSTAQSKTISTVLKKIKSSIDKINRSTSSVLEKFQDIDKEVRIVSDLESNIRSAMEEQSEGSKQILQAISHLQDTTSQVKDGSEKMLKDSHKVIKESESLAEATKEINEGVNEIASGADYINSAVERVHVISNDNKEHIGTLSKEVEKFKVNKNSDYIWDKTFAVGHEQIDEQHRQLFAALNNLVKACFSKNRVEFNNGISFLAKYVDKHFSDEEVIQKGCGYPDYPAHRKIHEDYKAAVKTFGAKWTSWGTTEQSLNEIREHVGGWLINHIKGQDVKIGAYIRSLKK